MAGFPKLIPAFTVRVAIAPPTPISPTLTFASFVPSASTIISEPSYPLQIDATVEHGADYIKLAADGGHVRLDVQSMARDARSGGLLRFSYRGKIATGGEAGRVLRGEEGAGTTGFGEAFTIVEFEAGNKELAVLEEKVYVGSGRFVIEPGQPVIVEYKISEVSA
ncbi:hypothetical protein C8A01DRAFT_41740 [Parachaetomium inaequale]|uniref:Uncharacterized protein n=1 Tax=Parachaetomium inaequale TaxID=2588326 RepID=A0AAN6SKK6_9PEZI|nr:hypothetical protein C8A01DRAFT_41740 [Parachaetomium inaequale]